jgi:hypothetical protein
LHYKLELDKYLPAGHAEAQVWEANVKPLLQAVQIAG